MTKLILAMNLVAFIGLAACSHQEAKTDGGTPVAKACGCKPGKCKCNDKDASAKKDADCNCDKDGGCDMKD